MSRPRKPRYGNPARRAMELRRMQQRAQPNHLSDPRQFGGDIVSLGDDTPTEVLLDTTDSVLLESVNISCVEMVRQGKADGPAVFMVLEGRVNKSPDQVRVGFLLGPDGMAAVVTQLLGVADRFGPQLLGDITRRMVQMEQKHAMSIPWLKAAIELAQEQANAE